MSFDKPVVLVLEDDSDLASELTDTLEEAGFEAVSCSTIRNFWAYISNHEVDILIIDLGLPDGWGADVVREVRAKSDVPIIITSGRSEVEERVAGIEIGADDYLGKPYNGREIVAKLSRFLTRTRGTKFSSRVSQLAGAEVFRFSNFALDTGAMSLTSPAGEDIPLTTFEFLTLKALVERPNKVLTRASLVDFVHTENWHGSERTIDNLISRVRTKLSRSSDQNFIKTVRGIGYMFSSSDMTRG